MPRINSSTFGQFENDCKSIECLDHVNGQHSGSDFGWKNLKFPLWLHLHKRRGGIMPAETKSIA